MCVKDDAKSAMPKQATLARVCVAPLLLSWRLARCLRLHPSGTGSYERRAKAVEVCRLESDTLPRLGYTTSTGICCLQRDTVHKCASRIGARDVPACVAATASVIKGSLMHVKLMRAAWHGI